MKKILAASCLLAGTLLFGTSQATVLTDPAGDAVATFGSGGPLHDIAALDFNAIGGDLYISLWFHTPVVAPSADPGGIVGYIELDTDQSAATGRAPTQNVIGGGFDPLPLGIDYVVDLFSEASHPGEVDILDGNTSAIIGTVFAFYGASSIDLTIPLSMLGGDDGVMNATAIVGTFDQPTDAINAARVPLPGTWLLFGLLPLLWRRSVAQR